MREEFIGKTNIIDDIDESTVAKLRLFCTDGLRIDEESIAEWTKDVEEIRKLADQHQETKNYPFEGASNVKYPLITTAALQFNARAYPAIVNNGSPVFAKVVGRDDGQVLVDEFGQPVIDEAGQPAFAILPGAKKQRADRVAQHMAYQLLEEMETWDSDMDSLLLSLAIEGVSFKKVYYDSMNKKVCSDLVISTDLIVHNWTKSLSDCPRISHLVSFYPYEVQSKIASGEYKEWRQGDEDDMQKPMDFVEQHVRFDIDDDGYSEPYIVTFHKESGQIVRIVANFDETDINKNENGELISVNARQYFVKYECFPDSQGRFYSKGLGHLILPLNNSVDSILNQLIDAGHLANTGGGFIANSFRVSGGKLRFKPGEWKKVDVSGMAMKDAVMPLPIRDPSPVLFQLLGILIDAAKEISSVKDVMTGGGGANTPVQTIMAQIEQGMKVYTSIFKRIYRSLKQEFALIYNINSDYLMQDSYEVILDDQTAIVAEDYDKLSQDVRPAADPNMATNIQKAVRDQFLMQFANDPMMNGRKIRKEIMESMGIQDPESYFAPPQDGPTPEQLEKMAELRLKEREQDRKDEDAEYNNLEKLARALEAMARADEMDPNNPLNLTEISTLKAIVEEKLNGKNDERAIQEMVAGQ